MACPLQELYNSYSLKNCRASLHLGYKFVSLQQMNFHDNFVSTANVMRKRIEY